MNIPIGKIAAWIGRAVLSAIVSEAADRLSRPKPHHDRHGDAGENQHPHDDRLDRE